VTRRRRRGSWLFSLAGSAVQLAVAVVIVLGVAGMFIVPILFFYPLYWVWLYDEPVAIFGHLFYEPNRLVLLLEMALCILAWLAAFLLFAVPVILILLKGRRRRRR